MRKEDIVSIEKLQITKADPLYSEDILEFRVRLKNGSYIESKRMLIDWTTHDHIIKAIINEIVNDKRRYSINRKVTNNQITQKEVK